MTEFHLPDDEAFSPTRTTIIRRVPYGSWLLSLVAWDGILPVVVLFAPRLVKTLFPNQRQAMEITGALLPVAAFFVRFFVAKRHINSNRCTRLTRWIQLATLCVAILVLLLIDTMLILADDLPNGALFATPDDVTLFVVMVVMYLSCMAFALYPGSREEVSHVEWRDVDPLQDLGATAESS